MRQEPLAPHWGQVLSWGWNPSIKESKSDLDEDLIRINLQNRDFSLIIIVSVALKASRLGYDQSRKAGALGIGERTNCGGGFFLFFVQSVTPKTIK